MGDKVAWSQTTDNMYITILMNYGVFGFLLFLQMIIYAIKRVIYTTDKNVLFGCSGLIALFFELFFFEGLYWPIVYEYYRFIYGVCYYRNNDWRITDWRKSQ